MRKIDLIVIHCTATRIGCPLSPEALDRMHRQRGFNGCGYHYYVRRDGMICSMRPVERVGAHVKGLMRIASGWLMRVAWMRRGIRRIRVRRSRSMR